MKIMKKIERLKMTENDEDKLITTKMAMFMVTMTTMTRRRRLMMTTMTKTMIITMTTMTEIT